MRQSKDHLTGDLREEGFYYIKYRYIWTIMEYWEGFFYDKEGDGVTGKGRKSFEVIGPRIPMPDEPAQVHYGFAYELGKIFTGEDNE